MFYVAMTRAKKELTVCYAKKQSSHEMKPSRFLKELRGEAPDAGIRRETPRAGQAAMDAAPRKKERKNPLEDQMNRLRSTGW